MTRQRPNANPLEWLAEELGIDKLNFTKTLTGGALTKILRSPSRREFHKIANVANAANVASVANIFGVGGHGSTTTTSCRNN